MQIKGTFLDEISHDIPHQNWGEKEWDADFGYMHRAGIEHVILIRCGYRPDIVVIKPGSNDFSTVILPGVTNWDSDMGANYHPNHHGHRKLAMSVIPYIATITGWELPDTSVE